MTLDNPRHTGDNSPGKTASGASLEEMEELVESLRKESQSKSNLLGIVTHDLLSPATSIAGLTKLLLKPGAVSNLSERQVNILQTMDRAMDRYMETLTNIMELSRLIRGKVALSPSNISCESVIENALAQVRAHAEEKGIVIQSEYKGKEKVFADQDNAQRIFARLLENAVMFSPAGGRVVVACRIEADHIVMEVMDNGVGIEKERLDRIFDIDGKKQTFGTSDEKGSGLGLCIAKRMAILCGGDLTLDSAPGQGTEVRLKLPRGQ
ncbi:MAG: HAMP domain-containing histidine kinase [Nitrospinota bacterium]|nr:HAMP domain-containing histidine kinase [Nitrospinota bacterium]MDH5678009.1 HAMP domain-containing histidine kinase [Nitrospinota bacterium]MDH5756011.1 HAMP domain-containing histidine kinase [Nitrospinota bacterium]